MQTQEKKTKKILAYRAYHLESYNKPCLNFTMLSHNIVSIKYLWNLFFKDNRYASPSPYHHVMQNLTFKKIKTKALQFFACIMFMLCLQGCINVNLKSVLPNQTYYSLDSVTLVQECKKPTMNLALNISVLSPYDGKDILVYDNDLAIKILESAKWIDLPKNMIRNAFLKIAVNNCLRIEQNPSITQKIPTLRLNFNDLYIQSQDEENTAHIILYFEVIGYDMNRLKNGVIKINVEDKNPAKALQKAMIDALNQVVQQIKTNQT